MKSMHWQSYVGSNFQSTSIIQKISLQHSHYVTLTLKCAVVSKQNLPSFKNYGWEIVEKNIAPIFMENLRTPLPLIELSECDCKTGCKANRCKCKKIGFTCTVYK